MLAPGNVGLDASIAATEIARSAAAGEPVTYALGPLLPAEATTTTPASDALFEATESGASGLPIGSPSDMLITSAPSATAWSMAATTTAAVADPSQPKTR